MKSSGSLPNTRARFAVVATCAFSAALNRASSSCARPPSSSTIAVCTTPSSRPKRSSTASRAARKLSASLASALRYDGRGPSAASASQCASICASSGRRPIHTTCAPQARIACSVHTRPRPPAPPIATYTPPGRYGSAAGAGSAASGTSPRANHWPCRCSSNGWPPSALRACQSAGSAAASGRSMSRTRQCGYSFASAPHSPARSACAGNAGASPGIVHERTVSTVRSNARSPAPSASKRFTRRNPSRLAHCASGACVSAGADGSQTRWLTFASSSAMSSIRRGAAACVAPSAARCAGVPPMIASAPARGDGVAAPAAFVAHGSHCGANRWSPGVVMRGASRDVALRPDASARPRSDAHDRPLAVTRSISNVRRPVSLGASRIHARTLSASGPVNSMRASDAGSRPLSRLAACASVRPAIAWNAPSSSATIRASPVVRASADASNSASASSRPTAIARSGRNVGP
ncbi:Uncharacterised protein [Burkholderia pseudomallei]|nr:Uncharacterised protein [Burkholderia pseudomallei]CAJ6219938.1 Uncharacterised protein [Burkholderia pseudomallei]CAJ7595776.1 Uncharacterised protein [Burkholderia pseudomallei]CFW80293.1 Uncharacterised protein [Burkholderia pseudomallei]